MHVCSVTTLTLQLTPNLSLPAMPMFCVFWPNHSGWKCTTQEVATRPLSRIFFGNKYGWVKDTADIRLIRIFFWSKIRLNYGWGFEITAEDLAFRLRGLPTLDPMGSREHPVWGRRSGVPPLATANSVFSEPIVDYHGKGLEIDKDMLRIIISAEDELSAVTNVDDLGWPWTNLARFKVSYRAIFAF